MSQTSLGFGSTDLTRTRFAFHLPWLIGARAQLGALALEPLHALIRPSGYLPDFITPPPSTPMPDFAQELATLRRTPPELVRLEVGRVWARQTPPPAAQVFLDDPAAALETLAAMLDRYWTLLLAPHWPRWRSMLEEDVLLRGRALALYGPEQMFNALSPLIRFTQGRLLIEHSLCAGPDAAAQLEGRGLVLIPSAFVWPAVMTILDPPWQPTLAYTPLGLGGLWSGALPPAHAATEALMGKGRARIFVQLEIPATTHELAGRLCLAPSSVSQHLSALKQAGLVDPRRRGRAVYYALSNRGRQLRQLFEDQAAPLPPPTARPSIAPDFPAAG
ncbi:DUF5937 family protein [Deinococcus sp.]|uniref:ArsR/SmtB family transcription factor n=1 Tax=Deinococcus sp. TaxID=47478 RepID=UPI003C7DEF19